MPTPNDLFDVWSPDQVAECLDGVPTELYSKIWNEIVPLYDGQERSEVPDDFGKRCLKNYWDKFTEEEQNQLNAAAEAHDKEWGIE